MTRRDIELRIDELVLTGGPAVDGLEVAAAVEREITRMLATQGLPPTMERRRRIDAIRGEPLERTGDLTAGEMGQQVGRSVYGGLHGE